MGYYVSIDGDLTFANEEELQKFLDSVSNTDTKVENVETYIKNELGIKLQRHSSLDYDIYESDIRHSDQDLELAGMLETAGIDAELTLYVAGDYNRKTTYKNKISKTEEIGFISEATAEDIFENMNPDEKDKLMKLLSESSGG